MAENKAASKKPAAKKAAGTAQDPTIRTGSGNPKKAAPTKKVSPEVVRPSGRKKGPAQKAVESTPVEKTEYVGKFAPEPDPAKSGPPFTFDANNQCQNPIVNTLRLPGGVAVYLTVGEREDAWGGSFRADIPKDKAHPDGHTIGADKPYVGGGTLGYTTREQAMYNAGIDALGALKDLYGPNPKDKAARSTLFEMENAVAALKPKSLALLESTIAGYQPRDAERYSLAINQYVKPHHSGAIIQEDTPEEAYKDILRGVEHSGQRYKWIRADAINHGRKHFPKLVEELVGEATRQTIYNESNVAKVFPIEDRRWPELTFTHYQEVAGQPKAKREKLLDQCVREGLTAGKLRKLVQGPREEKQEDGSGSTTTAETTTSTTTTVAGDKSPETGSGGSENTDTRGWEERPRDEPEGGKADASSEFAEEDGPAEKAEKDYDSLMAHLDDAQTLLKRGACNPEFIKPTRIQGIRVIVSQLAEALGLKVVK